MGRPAYYPTPEEFDKAVDDYFRECVETNEPVTITGLCLTLGFCDKRSFYDYEEREEFSHSVKRARLRVEMNYEKKLLGNNAAGPIFALKISAGLTRKNTKSPEG